MKRAIKLIYKRINLLNFVTLINEREGYMN